MDALCKDLSQRFPTKKIIFITPTEQNNNGANLEIKTGYTAKDYANVMNIICSKYGIPVFDANACSGINPVIGDISGMYTTDSLHLNDAGHERLGVLLSQFLLNPFSVGVSPSYPVQPDYIGKTLTVHSSDNGFIHLTALVEVDSDMVSGSKVQTFLKGSNPVNMGLGVSTELGGTIFTK